MNDTLRKAAILVSTLDRHTADALLDQMPSEQADRVRRAALALEAIDPLEQQRVIAEFLAQEEGEGNSSTTPSPLVATREAWQPPQPERLSRPGDSPFGFLREADSQKIRAFLEGEHPQTIAVIVSHLAPQCAMSLLAGLRSELQADVIQRLVNLDDTDPEILREVERGLEARISRHIRIEERRTAGLAAVVNILAAADPALERKMLVNLARHAPELARQIPRTAPLFAFEDLAWFELTTLAAIVRAADPQVTILALAGSSVELVQRVLHSLPMREAEELQQAWRHLGPTPLSDIEAAQRAIVELVQQLEAAGQIELPLASTTHLSAA